MAADWAGDAAALMDERKIISRSSSSRRMRTIPRTHHAALADATVAAARRQGVVRRARAVQKSSLMNEADL